MGPECFLFRLGAPERVEWYCQGQPATRQEIKDAIESGFPILAEMAAKDGPIAQKATGETVQRDAAALTGCVKELMPNEPDNDEPKMIGLDMLLSLGPTDRAQAIWDRAMTPEAHEHMKKRAVHNAGRGPDPGYYQGPVVDFTKAAKELEEEEPETHPE
jgi:hypothetical protein